MEQNDFLLREIEKLTLLLKNLISKVIESSCSYNLQIVLEQINNDLLSQFGFTLNSLNNIDDSELAEMIKYIDIKNIELLTELLSTSIYKINSFDKLSEFNMIRLIDKVIFLLDYLDTKTKTFSIKRMNLKTEILKYHNKH